MLTASNSFICPNCNTQDHQEILFIGSEFSYRCKNCQTYHLFLENLYWDFVQNFKYQGCGSYKWYLNRYIGSLTNDKKWIDTYVKHSNERNDFVANAAQHSKVFFEKILNIKPDQQCKIEVKNLSDKIMYGKTVYIANAICSDHFQDCLRAVVRMKEHTIKPISSHTYNILILDKKTQFCIDPTEKINGLDEAWIVDWSPKMTWCYGMNHLNDLKESLSLNNAITQKLYAINNFAYAISKDCSPTIYGNQPILDLFYLKDFKLYDQNNRMIENKYVAILIHADGNIRAGLGSQEQLIETYEIIQSYGFEPMIIACADNEEQIVKNMKDYNILIAKNIKQQICFYSRYCLGVVGTNCSGCNIPCLYRLPVFTMAKERSFPDDFYCMGRLLSPYDCTTGFNGDLTKPRTVTEIKIDNLLATSINLCLDVFVSWLKTLER